MAKSNRASDDGAKPAARIVRLDDRGYLAWSRDPAVGVVAVLPLWLLYEGLQTALRLDEVNGAEALVIDTMRALGPRAEMILRILMTSAVLLAAVSVLRRNVPWARVALVSALEGTFYGLSLGPLTSALTVFLLEGGTVFLSVARSSPLVPDLVSSLGAGIFEEALFRLGLLSLLALLFGWLARDLRVSLHFGTGLAVLISSLMFSWFHHVGPGHEPFEVGVFVFRAVAGVVLGMMFVLRGFAVCVYAHALYDVHYYLSQSP